MAKFLNIINIYFSLGDKKPPEGGLFYDLYLNLIGV